MKKYIFALLLAVALFPANAFAHRNMGGHYAGGHGSSHKGGHYKNARTGNHYTHHQHGYNPPDFGDGGMCCVVFGSAGGRCTANTDRRRNSPADRCAKRRRLSGYRPPMRLPLQFGQQWIKLRRAQRLQQTGRSGPALLSHRCYRSNGCGLENQEQPSSRAR